MIIVKIFILKFLKSLTKLINIYKYYMSIYFLVLNMNKNKDRWINICSMLDNIGASYKRIEAIDGFKLESNLDAKQILTCKPELLNSIFKCKTFDQEWIYDGHISKAFPGLNIHGHQGAKGLILSNIKAFYESLNVNNNYIYALNDDNKLNYNEYKSNLSDSLYKYKWFCILEDDAIINKEIYEEIIMFVKDKDNADDDVILLDKRVGGGAAGVLYNSKIIPLLTEELHPLSKFSINMEEHYSHATLWDWKLWHYINNNNIKFKILPCIDSGGFNSTINI